MTDSIGSLTTLYGFQTPREIVYGIGAIDRLSTFVTERNVQRALVVTDRELERIGTVDPVFDALNDAGVSADIYDGITTEPKIQMVTEVVEAVEATPYDLVVGAGGGSCMDAAKIASVVAEHPVSVRDVIGMYNVPGAGLPLALIPTTAGTGSEVTNAAVVTDTDDRNLKKAVYSDYLFADLAVIDPQFTETLPATIAAGTGADALTHAIEGYVSKRRSPMTDIICQRAIELIGENIEEAVTDKSDEARYNMILAAALAGIGFSNSSVGAVHALTYPVGVKAEIGHGVSNAVLLPYVMKYNIPSERERFAEIAQMLGVIPSENETTTELAQKGVETVFDLNTTLDLPTSLRELDGIDRAEFETYAEIAIEYSGHNIDRNPRELDRKDVIEIFEDAYTGSL